MVLDIGVGKELARIVIVRLYKIIAVLVFAKIAIRIIDLMLNRFFDFTKFDRTLEKFFHKTVVMLLWLITLGILLLIFGIDLNTLVASFGVMSFIVGFALKDTLSNFASGVMILVNKPFIVGDLIEVKKVKGTVKTVTMTHTKIITEENYKVTLQNNIVWHNPIINYTAYNNKK